MPALLTTAAASDDLFTAWLDRSPARSRVRGRHPRGIAAGPRFAFYGRISTDGYQDPASSRQWQYDQAVRLTAGHGPVVAEYFDVGYSRCLPGTNGRTPRNCSARCPGRTAGSTRS
jgi:hypothetical protein